MGILLFNILLSIQKCVKINKKYVVLEIPEIYPEISGMTCPSDMSRYRYTLLQRHPSICTDMYNT